MTSSTPLSMSARRPSLAAEAFRRFDAALTPGLVGILEAPTVRRAASLLAALAAAAGRRVLVHETAGGFDPHAVARFARLWGADPRALLGRIRVARGFTCHQAAALAGRARPRRADVLVLSGAGAIFLDEEVPDREARLLLRRFVEALARLRRRGTTVLMAQPTSSDGSDGPAGTAPRDRRGVMPLLRAAADTRLALDPGARRLYVASAAVQVALPAA